MAWFLVDDSKDERDAFARKLSEGGVVSVEPVSVTDARDRLAKNGLVADGLLMDIDLSNESTTKESGLGLTADIRAAQYGETTPPFPIIRFSYRAKVAANIGRDPSSDDYFDLKIDKDEVDNKTVQSVQRRLAGVAAVYERVNDEDTAAGVFEVDEDQWILWGNIDFEEDLHVADRAYLKARWIIQAIVWPGMLISEDLLATRLGIDRVSSNGWTGLCTALSDIRYTGVAASYFPRWWARGLEMWWETRSMDAPLAATPIAERHEVLSGEFPDLVQLTMPPSSPGLRPWRYCELTMQEMGDFVPLDPSCAVRLRLNLGLPEWTDPNYAALGWAVKHVEDPRLDQSDLNRLKPLFSRSGR